MQFGLYYHHQHIAFEPRCRADAGPFGVEDITSSLLFCFEI